MYENQKKFNQMISSYTLLTCPLWIAYLSLVKLASLAEHKMKWNPGHIIPCAAQGLNGFSWNYEDMSEW